MNNFLIHVNGKVSASLSLEENAFIMSYLREDSPEINPAFPTSQKDYGFNDLPSFLKSILPDEARMKWVAKSLHVESEDFPLILCHCLGTANVGHITLTPDAKDISTSIDGLSFSSPAPPVIAASDLNVLSNSDVQANLPSEIAKKAGITGIGGAFPKCFFRCPEGDFILKSYGNSYTTSPQELANLEQASLQSASACGLSTARCKAFGGMVASERFDMEPNSKMFHLKDLTNDRDKYAGSYEALRAQVETYCGKEGARDFTKQVLFSLILGDSDKHQENWAILENAKGEKRLSPMYDSLPSSFVTGDNELLALSMDGRKSKIGWHQIKKFTQNHMSEEECQEFLLQSCKSVEKIVLPEASPTIQKKLARHLFVFKKIASEKLEFGPAAKSLSQEISKSNEPAEKLSQTPLPEEMMMGAFKAVAGNQTNEQKRIQRL